MKNAFTIADRYASALFELSAEQKAVEDVAKNLRDLQTAVAEQDDLETIVYSNAVRPDEQSAAMLAVAKAAGFHALAQNFLGVLAKNRRLAFLDAIIKRFTELQHEANGQQAIIVTSATPLSKQQVSELTKELSQHVANKVTVENKVDPALLGGFKVQLGSKLIDASVDGSLNRLEQRLKETA